MSDLDPKRVLYAHNDTPKDREHLEALRQLNYEVLAASNFEKAKEASKSGPWNLVVACGEGAVRGLDLCEHLQEQKATKGIPILVMGDTSASKKSNASGYVKTAAPTEELLDWVERLIGLPPPPDGDEPRHTLTPGPDHRSFQKEIEELQEKVAYYQQQVKDVSISGEKSSNDMAQVLHDLQEDLDKARAEKSSLKDELELLKSGVAERDRDAQAKEKLLEDLKVESDRRQTEIRRELDELRATFQESDQKHKRALNALREYYKGKSGQSAKLEKKISLLQDELTAAKAQVQPLEAEVKKLKEELVKARELVTKAKQLFS